MHQLNDVHLSIQRTNKTIWLRAFFISFNQTQENIFLEEIAKISDTAEAQIKKPHKSTFSYLVEVWKKRCTT